MPTPDVRILLDENLNWRLERFLPGHEVTSVTRIGWAGLKNGKLLARAQEKFDVLITMDNSLASQQNLARFRLAIVALRALKPLARHQPVDAHGARIVADAEAGARCESPGMTCQ